MQLLLLLLIVLVLVTGITGTIGIYIYQHARKRINKLISILLMPLPILVVLFVIGAFFLAIFFDMQDDLPGKYFHDFNGHLKSLCIEEPEKNECPRTEKDLEAFNPKKYRFMKKYGATYYSYDDKTGDYAWIFRQGESLYVASNLLENTFAYINQELELEADGATVLSILNMLFSSEKDEILKKYNAK